MEQAYPINQPMEIKFIDPVSVISKLDFQPEMKVADFGCATGYFVFPLSKKIGNGGIIYALDILPEKLETVESQARLLGLTNIITNRVNLERPGGSKLDDESVDWVLLVNMLFQNHDKNSIIQEAKRVLKKDGSILVIEWNDSTTLFGPPQNVRIPKDEILKLAQNNQLKLQSEIPVSNFHYGLLFKK
jgi:ubiquinone/menaquinone biosynthesis C-methylase UbiE